MAVKITLDYILTYYIVFAYKTLHGVSKPVLREGVTSGFITSRPNGEIY